MLINPNMNLSNYRFVLIHWCSLTPFNCFHCCVLLFLIDLFFVRLLYDESVFWPYF